MRSATCSLLAASLLCLPAVRAHAAPSAAAACEAIRYTEAGKHYTCQQKGIASEYKKPSLTGQGPSSKCRTKYAAVWAKLQGKMALAGTVCDGPRFVNNGNGTFTDNLTGLQWEQKTSLDGSANLINPHDADNTYSLCEDVLAPVYGCDNGGVADGTVYTDFLGQLNAGGFAGSSDWRLPTFAESESLTAGPYPCALSPCIDPIAGPTVADYYWASLIVSEPEVAYVIGFSDGFTAGDVKGHPNRVRAVRGGY
jgi:hypothetical protein